MEKWNWKVKQTIKMLVKKYYIDFINPTSIKPLKQKEEI